MDPLPAECAPSPTPSHSFFAPRPVACSSHAICSAEGAGSSFPPHVLYLRDMNRSSSTSNRVRSMRRWQHHVVIAARRKCPFRLLPLRSRKSAGKLPGFVIKKFSIRHPVDNPRNPNRYSLARHTPARPASPRAANQSHTPLSFPQNSGTRLALPLAKALQTCN